MATPEGENITVEEEEEEVPTAPHLLLAETLTEEAETARFLGHTRPVISLSYAPETQILATGSDDETVGLFNISTQQQVDHIRQTGQFGQELLSYPVRAVCIAPDGSQLFVATRENAIKVYTLDGTMRTLSGLLANHEQWVRTLSLNWESRILASAGNDCTVRLWDLNQMVQVKVFVCTARAVSVAINNRYVFASFHDRVAKGFRIDDETAPPVEFTGHSAWINNLAVTERYLLTGSDDKTARVYDLESLDCISVLRGHTLAVTAVALCRSNTRAATGSNDSSVIYWSLGNGGAPLLRIASTFGSVRAVTFLRNQHELCFSGWDCSVRVYDLNYIDNKKIEALCYAGCDRLGMNAPIRRIINRDILARVRNILLKTPH